MEDILQMMSQIEDDVAKFYEKIYQMKGLQNYEDIFRFMSLHSKHHSETLKSIVSDYKDIPLNKTKYITFVNKLKSNLLSKINETTDRQEISALLEEAEGLLGYAYEQIAKHMDAKAKMMLEASDKDKENCRRRILTQEQSERNWIENCSLYCKYLKESILNNFRLISGLILFSVTIFITTGCSPVYYAPDTVHVPLHKEAGELRIAGGSSGGDDVGATGFQGSMAIMDNVAVMASLMLANESDDNNENDDEGTGSGHIFNLGAGYFTSYGPLVLEAYGGMGWGSAFNDLHDDGTIKAKFTRPFVQPSIGLRFKIIEFAVSSRFSFVDYNRVSGENLSSFYQEEVEELKAMQGVWFWEPAVTARVGTPFLKAQLQLCGSSPMNENDFPGYEGLMISFGVITCFDLF